MRRSRPALASGAVARAASALPLLVVAVAIWRILGPAILSPDSLAQYRQALAGEYDDWHPPLLALALHVVLRAGGGIATLMLVQTVAGLLGAQALAAAWASAWTEPSAGASVSGRAAWLGGGVALLLVLPFSPLPFYLMTFWKDSCAIVLLSWATALATRLAAAARVAARLAASESPAIEGAREARIAWWRASTFALLVALLALVRHNAVVVLPIAALVLWLVVPARRRSTRALVALLPIALFLVGQTAIDRLAQVRHEHMERHLMIADLVGLAIRRPATLAEMSHLRPRLLVPPADLHRYYQPGAMTGPAVSPDLFDDPAGLRADYLRAAGRFPLDLAAVKLGELAGVAGWRETHLFIYFPQVEPNDLGLALWPQHAALRDAWGDATLATSVHPLGRLVFATHWVWILVTLGWLVAAWRTGRRALAVVLLMPLAYYASYALAAPAPDYRLMEPSTMVVQCATMAWLLARAVRRRTESHSAQAAASLAGSPRSTSTT